MEIMKQYTKKTLGPVSANLILALYEKDRTIFTLKDIESIAGLKGNAARDLAHKMVARDLIVRIKPGKFIIIPQEIGTSRNYIGNWYVIAREIVKSPDYYIAFRSAMSIHNMTNHPLTKVYIVTPIQERVKMKKVKSAAFEFFTMKEKYIWGIHNSWVTKTDRVRVSDVERTIIDCLYKPEYSGGTLEIAQGIWMQKENINMRRLIDYAIRYGKIVVIKRLGYLLETLELVKEKGLKELRSLINEKYYLLDPLQDKQDTHKNSWKIIANISPEEIKGSVET